MNIKKTVLITGGTRGIGRAIAIEFGRNNVNTAIIYAGNEEAMHETKNELEKIEGLKFEFYKGDISNFDFCEKTTKEIIEKFGSIEVLVNNAGITNDKLLLKMTTEDFKSVIDINLVGTFNMIKAVSKIMMKNRSGSIINLSSIVGLKGNAGQCNYSASKAGIIGLTKSLAKELGSRNIRLNAISPGFVNTDMTDALNDETKEKLKDIISLRRPADPSEIAKLAVFLGLDDSSYITGENIEISGGMTI